MTDLPLPLSPTSATVSPAAISNDTPFTAYTVASGVSKRTSSPSTRSSGSVIA